MFEGLVFCAVIYNIILSIIFNGIKEDEIDFPVTLKIMIWIFVFVPFIGCFFVLGICSASSTGRCDICSKKTYFDNDICKQCKNKYEIKDEEDVRLAKTKYRISKLAKERAIDKEIKVLEEEFELNKNIDWEL